jgi:hypothetical protein
MTAKWTGRSCPDRCTRACPDTGARGGGGSPGFGVLGGHRSGFAESRHRYARTNHGETVRGFSAAEACFQTKRCGSPRASRALTTGSGRSRVSSQAKSGRGPDRARDSGPFRAGGAASEQPPGKGHLCRMTSGGRSSVGCSQGRIGGTTSAARASRTRQTPMPTYRKKKNLLEKIFISY